MVLEKKNRKRRIGEVVVSAREEKERKENLVRSEKKRTAPFNTLGVEILTSKPSADFSPFNSQYSANSYPLS